MKSEPNAKSMTYGVLAIAFGLVFCLVLLAKVRYTSLDPHGWLLVTESILTHGTIKLDHYGANVLLPYGYVISQANGHFYHYFPLGTPIASLPFVAVAELFGMGMLKYDGTMQVFIAACVNVFLCIYMFKLARLWMAFWPSLGLSILFWMGSTYASTGGTALWSHDFAVLFATMAIYYAMRGARLGESGWWPLIGLLLFAAYFTRPPLSILTPCLLLFMLSYHRLQAVLAGVVVVALFGLFVVFSLHEFGQILPDYYLPIRLEGGKFWTALAGNLISPARGFLVFSPFVLTVWLCRGLAEKSWGLKPTWLLVGLVWPVAHLILISRFPHWWGGAAFGPRFTTDALPGVFLLMLYAWPVRWPQRRQAALAGVFALSLAFSVFVNTYQGLFNRYSLEWNIDPNVDIHPEYVFDWRYPQFAVNKVGHQQRIIRAGLKDLGVIAPGEVIDYKSTQAIWAGWSGPETSFRWANDRSVVIVFKLGEPLPQLPVHLVVRAGTLGPQHVTMRLNGHEIYSAQIDSNDTEISVDLPKDGLQPGRNDLEFVLPDARRPGNGDLRQLALAFRSLRLD